MHRLFKIKDYPHYYINEAGQVYSNYTNKKMCQQLQANGYLTLFLVEDGKKYKTYIHRLLAQTFIPNPNNYPCIDHINRNKLDNRLSNLRWVTHHMNCQNRKISSRNIYGVKYIYKNGKKWVYDRCFKGERYIKRHADIRHICFEFYIHQRLLSRSHRHLLVS